MTDTTDILDRARQAQHDAAHATYLQIRLDFLQDLVWEIEQLRARLGPASRAIGSIKDVNARHQLKEDPS